MHVLRASSILFCASLVGQSGAEIVFVGTSVGGGTDPHFFASQNSGTVLVSGGNANTDNVTDAVWADAGSNLYVAQSIRPQVSRAQWNGTAATWSTFFSAPARLRAIKPPKASVFSSSLFATLNLRLTKWFGLTWWSTLASPWLDRIE